MKTSVKVTLFAVFFLALAGVGAGIYLFNMQHKDLLKVKPDFVITSYDLQKAFEENEAFANEKFVNKIIEVTGNIESVKTGDDGIKSVALKTGSELSSVICTISFQTDIVKLTVGDELTIRGECSGFLMDILLNNCVIIK